MKNKIERRGTCLGVLIITIMVGYVMFSIIDNIF